VEVQLVLLSVSRADVLLEQRKATLRRVEMELDEADEMVIQNALGS
jgi:hypothetical protein